MRRDSSFVMISHQKCPEGESQPRFVDQNSLRQMAAVVALRRRELPACLLAQDGYFGRQNEFAAGFRQIIFSKSRNHLQGILIRIEEVPPHVENQNPRRGAALDDFGQGIHEQKYILQILKK